MTLRDRILLAVGHSVSCPATQKAVKHINDDYARTGRRPPKVTRGTE